MSHSHGTFWFLLLSPSVFFVLSSAWCSFDRTISRSALPTLIRRNSHRLYKNPLGIPISVLIPLSIEGNNINHIISHQGDKVGLALSVSCHKSRSGFFSPHLFIYWISLDALTLMLLFMSGKLLFDIQIMWEGGGEEGPFLCLGSVVKIACPPRHLAAVSNDGLVLISSEKQRWD